MGVDFNVYKVLGNEVFSNKNDTKNIEKLLCDLKHPGGYSRQM